MFDIPLPKPEVTPEDIEAVTAVLRSGRLALGPVQTDFEESFAHRCGVPYAVAVSSGTAALHLAVRMAGVAPGDEVIVSPFSFVASANVVLYQRARPVFVDIEEETYGIDPDQLPDRLTRQTRAILPTHVFGQPCRISSIARLARQHGLVLIEDNCESIGASVPDGQGSGMTGQFGDFVAYGFYPNKQMTTGEGGMLTVTTSDHLDQARSLRNQGRAHDDSNHLIHDTLGFNYRMSEMQAALGLSQLGRIEASIRKRQVAAGRYHALLQGVADVILPASPEGYGHSWFVYSVRVPAGQRDEVIRYLAGRGIQSKAYFHPPIHLQPYYQQEFGFREGDFPVAERVSREIIALPMYNQITTQEIERVVESLDQALHA